VTLRIEGEVRNPRALRVEDLAALPQVSDLGARVKGKEGPAVELGALLDLVKAADGAAFATLASADGKFAVSVPLAAIRDNAVIAYGVPADKGGPIRFYVLQARDGVDACANVKALGTIRLTRDREPEIGHSH
jgi:DMSO/TMAO reductase YedYZ molybdopterin-dependent catalytic subunit